MNAADAAAFDAIAHVRPRLVDLLPAREAFAFPERTLLHAGPPFGTAASPPAAVLNSAAAAAVFEGWAGNRADALRSLKQRTIALAPAQDFSCAVPLASVLSPSQQVQKVIDAEGRAAPAFAPLNGGSGPALRLGLPGPEVVEHLRWLNGPFATVLRPAFRRGTDLLPLADDALVDGDDLHGRTQAATLRLAALLDLGETDEDVLATCKFLAASPSFFLNLWMAAVKCMLGGAAGVPGSAVIVAMGGNGIDVGLRLSGRPQVWHLDPSSPPVGKLESGIDAADRLPAIGDSALVDAFGFGALAFGHSPVQTQMLGAFMPMPAPRLAERLLHGPHPGLPRSGARYGLSARTVVQTGTAPVVALGVLDRTGERGRVGGGIWQASVAHFARALANSSID